MQRSSGTSKAKLVVGNNPLTDFDATVIGTGVLSEGLNFNLRTRIAILLDTSGSLVQHI